MCFICFITIHPIFPARTRPPDTMGKLGGEQGTLLVAYVSNQLLKQGQQHSSWVRFFAGIIEKLAKNEYLRCTEILQPNPLGKHTLKELILAASIRSLQLNPSNSNLQELWTNSSSPHLVGQAATLSGWTGTTFRCLVAWVLFSCRRKLVHGW